MKLSPKAEPQAKAAIRYFAVGNHYDSAIDRGFENTEFVAEFASRAERDEWLSDSRHLGRRKLSAAERKRIAGQIARGQVWGRDGTGDVTCFGASLGGAL